MANKIYMDTQVMHDLSIQITGLDRDLAEISGRISHSLTEVQRVASGQERLIGMVSQLQKNAMSASQWSHRLSTAVKRASEMWDEAEKNIAQKASSTENMDTDAKVKLNDFCVQPLSSTTRTVYGAKNIVSSSSNTTDYILSKKEAEKLLDFLFAEDVVKTWWLFGTHYSPDNKVRDYYEMLTGQDTGKSPEELDELKREFLMIAEMQLTSRNTINTEMLKARNERLMSYALNKKDVKEVMKGEIGEIFPAGADLENILTETDFTAQSFIQKSMDAKKIEAIMNASSTMKNIVQADNADLVYETWNNIRDADTKSSSDIDRTIQRGKQMITDSSHNFNTVDYKKMASQLYEIEKSLMMNQQ